MPTYDHRRDRLLAHASRVFAEKGYAGTSMRDLARASGMSLAGMYYYVKGKEDLLFQIQKAVFDQVTRGARDAVAREAAPEARLSAFIRHHVTFFATHMPEMKVLVHEAESCSGEMLEELRRVKRSYLQLMLELLAPLDGKGPQDRSRTVAGFTLFGMMNWVYTWYHPNGPVSVTELADTITKLFLNGYHAEAPVR